MFVIAWTLACSDAAPVDSDTFAGETGLAERSDPAFRWTQFPASEAVDHTQVPAALFASEGTDTVLRWFYSRGEGASAQAGSGGVAGAWTEGAGRYPYQLWVPDNPAEAMPLTLILHTRGEQGSDNSRQTETALARAWSENMEEPTLLLAPQAPSGTNAWSTSDLDSLIAEVSAAHNVDSGRLYVTGHSFGGAGTLSMLSDSEHAVAAAVVFAPSTRDYSVLDLDRLRTTSIWFAVSEADTVVDLSSAEAFFETLSAE